MPYKIANSLKYMFETEIEDYGESLISRFHDRFFPVESNKNENILTITDTRCLEILLIIGGLIVFGLLEIVFLTVFHFDFWGILILIGLTGINSFLIFKFSRSSYKRVCIFDKKENIFKIIRFTPIKNDRSIGKLDEIKKVKIEIKEFINSENGMRTYSFRSFLILNSLSANNDRTKLSLEQIRAVEIKLRQRSLMQLLIF